MKSTGLIRRFDDLGRIVIPKEIRRTLLLKEGDPMEIFIEDGGVYLKKYVPDYDIINMIDDIEIKLEFMMDEAGYKNGRDIQQKLKGIKELLADC